MHIYTYLLPFFKEIAPGWRKTQLVNLTLLAQALFRRRSLTLTELARAYPLPPVRKLPHPKHGLLHRLKRLSRFLDNPRLDQDTIMRSLTRLSYTVCQTPGLILPILVDLTYFEPFAVLSASVPRCGRAFPIAWRVFRRDLEGELELSQPLIIQDVLKRMRKRIAEGIQTVIVADREFASAAFFRFLKEAKSSFVIRMDAETWVLHAKYSGALSELGIKRGGRRIWLEGARYGKEEKEPVNVLAVWDADQEQPWFLVSDLADPRQVERLYRKRMKIEHGFRDWKHHLRLKGILRLRLVKHLERLLLGVIVLYWYVCLLGTRLKGRGYSGEVSCWGKLGDFKLGLELLELDYGGIGPTTKRLVEWAEDKLSGIRFSVKMAKWRQRRLKASLAKSG